jgi:hypothetical protein
VGIDDGHHIWSLKGSTFSSSLVWSVAAVFGLVVWIYLCDYKTFQIYPSWTWVDLDPSHHHRLICWGTSYVSVVLRMLVLIWCLILSPIDSLVLNSWQCINRWPWPCCDSSRHRLIRWHCPNTTVQRVGVNLAGFSSSLHVSLSCLDLLMYCVASKVPLEHCACTLDFDSWSLILVLSPMQPWVCSSYTSAYAFLGRTHECARLRGRQKSTRRASQHGSV